MERRRLYRSLDDRVIAGVCGGVAHYFDLDPTIVRVIWLLFSFFGGSAVIAYLIGVAVIPSSPSANAHEQSSRSSIWIALITVVAVIFLVQHGSFFHNIWFQFWDFAGNGLLAISLLVLVLFFIYVRKPEILRRPVGGSTTSIHLSSVNRKISGVCGGIGDALEVDPTLIRFLWVFGTIISGGIGIILYIALSLILPPLSSGEQP